jgi:hypothetical protein
VFNWFIIKTVLAVSGDISLNSVISSFVVQLLSLYFGILLFKAFCHFTVGLRSQRKNNS